MLSDFVGLQLLALLLENPTEDSVEIACDFMTEAGQVLSELTPAGVILFYYYIVNKYINILIR